MNKNENCTACNIKLDRENCKKNRTVCKSCFNEKKRKSNNNSLSQNENSASLQQSKIDTVKNNRTLIIGFSNCSKTYLFHYKLLQKQEPVFIIKKSLNQYPNIKAATSDENEQIENYENSIVVFDYMLLS